MRIGKIFLIGAFLATQGCGHWPLPSGSRVAAIVGGNEFPTGGPTVMPPDAVDLLLPLGCGAYDALIDDVTALTDADVEIGGNWLGLQATLSARATRIASSPDIARPLLLDALRDDKRFFAAHFILSSFEKPLIAFSSPVNGLDLEAPRQEQHERVLGFWNVR
jgi:hypothetical protein